MIRVTSVENMRLSDTRTVETKTPSKELMYQAGKGIFESVKWQGKTLIACGTGNNAGDGYVVATLLKEQGKDVELLLVEERFSPDGKYYFDKAKDAGVSHSLYRGQDLAGYDCVLDCIFGTGFKGTATGVAREVIERINASGAYVVSCDINSGLNGDSGMAELCVKSDLTVSIGDYKTGHFLNMAKDEIGNLINVDIGIDLIGAPYHLVEDDDARAFFDKRRNFSNKGTYGYITLLGGCTEYAGAIKLANMAGSAMRSGAGVVKLAVPRGIVGSVSPYLLESTLYPLSECDGAVSFVKEEIDGALGGSKAAGVGMGWGQRGDNVQILEHVLKNYNIPLVIDADGLNTLSKMDLDLVKNSACSVIVTPHPKELERLSGVSVQDILNDPVGTARDFAKKAGCVVLLKGPTTVITDGESVLLSSTGCPGMATAGSGDVLSGIITALCASHPNEPLMCAAVGAYINGKAGEIAEEQFGEISMLASDTARAIFTLWQE